MISPMTTPYRDEAQRRSQERECRHDQHGEGAAHVAHEVGDDGPGEAEHGEWLAQGWAHLMNP